MATERDDLIARPIRVVLFGGGPVLERGVKQFICRLDEHPEIEFLGAFCQSRGQSLRDVLADLWRRRGLLAIPLFTMNLGGDLLHLLTGPKEEISLNRKIDHLSRRIHFIPDIHAGEVLGQVRELGPDLGLIYGSPILKPELFEIPALGTLGIHHGKVPEYRGKKTTFWAVYNGEKTAGVTIQKVNKHLDAGEIVKEGVVPVGNRSLGSIWRELEKLGCDLYVQGILEIKNGSATLRPQSGVKGKLYHDPNFIDVLNYFRKRSLSGRSHT